MIRHTSSDVVAQFFSEKLGLIKSMDMRGALYIPERFRFLPAHPGHVGVGLAYHNFIGKTCTINIVVQRKECMTPQVVREAFEYPFIVCGLEWVFALIDSTNLDSVELCSRCGFKQVNRFENGGLDGDMLMFALGKSQCKWINRGKK